YMLNSSILTIHVHFMEYIFLANGTKLQLEHPVDLKVCDINDFHPDHHEFFKLNMFDSERPGYCLDNRNLTLKGQFTSSEFKFLRVYIRGCTGIDALTRQKIQ